MSDYHLAPPCFVWKRKKTTRCCNDMQDFALRHNVEEDNTLLLFICFYEASPILLFVRSAWPPAGRAFPFRAIHAQPPGQLNANDDYPPR
jgi:hypothetical protein